MSGNKVAPIKGYYETIQAMASHVAGDPDARRGIFIYFDEKDTMTTGSLGLTNADVGMLILEVLHMASRFK